MEDSVSERSRPKRWKSAAFHWEYQSTVHHRGQHRNHCFRKFVDRAKVAYKNQIGARLTERRVLLTAGDPEKMSDQFFRRKPWNGPTCFDSESAHLLAAPDPVQVDKPLSLPSPN